MLGIVGIDEVGRGPLAGPVTVCAVYCNTKTPVEVLLATIKDSKKLSPKKRKEWKLRAELLHPQLIHAIASVEAEEIDTLGIMGALRKAAVGALTELQKTNSIHHVYADYGIPLPDTLPATHLIKGDEQHPLIAMASILAKVHRDEEMLLQAKWYTEYGFERNKGYGTKEHREALKTFGVTQLHRRSFLKAILTQKQLKEVRSI